MQEELVRLMEIRKQNMRSHICDVTEDDYKEVMPKIDLLKSLSEIEHSIYAVYDMHKHNYLLKSTEQKKLFDNTDTENAKNDDTHLYTKIHPDDFAFVMDTDNKVYRFFSQLPANEKKDYKLVYDFRIRNTEGVYMRYMHQTIILEQDKNGKSWLSLVISNLLSELYARKKPQRRMINMKTGKLHLFNTDNEFNSTILLTRRETEVLSLIAGGYDSKTISEKLFISMNTVNNHRQNILRKTNTENTTQALLYCKRLGVI